MSLEAGFIEGWLKMPTAREQAREAAKMLYHPTNDPHIYEACVEAASDIWEPILRDLLTSLPSKDQAYDRLHLTRGYHTSDCACTQMLTCRYHNAIARAKEALGDV